MAYEEAMRLLSVEQYGHVADQFRELAHEEDPTHALHVSVDAVEDFHELRDKGGILGPLNIRVFYYVDKWTRTIVVVGAISKQNNGPTPLVVKVRMRRRVRSYLGGEYGCPVLAGAVRFTRRDEGPGS